MERVIDNRKGGVKFIHQASITLATDFTHELHIILGIWELFHRDNKESIDGSAMFSSIMAIIDEVTHCENITLDAATDKELEGLLENLEAAREKVISILVDRMIK